MPKAVNDLDIKRVMQILPHRYPILLVDRVIDIEENQKITTLKNVTFNEPHFQGHFPGAPVMPGVLIVEAMAQSAAILVVDSLGAEMEGRLVYFMTIDNTRFRKPVTPGDSLHITAEVIKSRGNIWKFKGVAKVDDVVHAEAEFSAMLMDERAETA